MNSTTIIPNFTGHDEHADAVKFAHALRPPPSGLYPLQQFCPSITPHSSCLDVLLFRGVLLVAYAAADEVVIARATDLQPVKRLRYLSSSSSSSPFTEQPKQVTALAFRCRDAAIAAAFGTTIVVFEGWSNAAKERASVYHSSCTETILDTLPLQEQHKNDVVSLSWDQSGLTLCAVTSNLIITWKLHPDYLPVRYTQDVVIPDSMIPAKSLAIAAISPDASLVAVSGLYARIAHVWDINKSHDSAEDLPRSVAEITHGRSGIAALDWKKRGGGNQALMTTDRDGTIRLWVRLFSPRHTKHPYEHHHHSNNEPRQQSQHHPDSTDRNEHHHHHHHRHYRQPFFVASGVDSWMEEIARSPHAERTPRAAAAFISWGGGGGVADDEGDAKATNAVHPMLFATAPKPSRCHHWIVRVAGGDASAWRVRGLDDRPRAEFTRLEPGSGEPLLGVEDAHEDELPKETPLRDISVAALCAVAPIPLTTESQYKVGLVKSYAISNGERRLRSPEPPEPPNIVAFFILAVKHGLPFLARYDLCPTSSVPAVCRTRIGLGHSSTVVNVVSSLFDSSSVLGTGGWLATQGSVGDVILWRTNVSTGAWGPMRAVALLPGPHTAVAFAPTKSASRNRWEVGTFACDAATASLKLYSFVNFVSRHDNSAASDVQMARQVAVCTPTSMDLAGNDPVHDLAVVDLHVRPEGISDVTNNRNNDNDIFMNKFGNETQNQNVRNRTKTKHASVSAAAAVIGVRRSGIITTWVMTRSQKDDVQITERSQRFLGDAHASASCVASNELASIGRQILVCGGTDGSLLLYLLGTTEGQVARGVDVDEIGLSEDEDEEKPSPTSASAPPFDIPPLWFKELCRLASSDRHGDAVVHIELMCGAARILAVHASGTCIVWARDTAEKAKWQVELVIPGSSLSSSLNENEHEHDSKFKNSAASLGYDRDGHLSVVVLRSDGLFDRYRRVLGQPWECVRRNEAPQQDKDSLPAGAHSIVHIGKGVLVTTSGAGLSVLGSTPCETQTSSYASDAAGYSPSKALVAQLLTGGRAWQVAAALDELHAFIKKVTKKTVSETSYTAGRGFIAPPPSLSVLLSVRDNVDNDDANNDDTAATAGLGAMGTDFFQLGAGRNLFMQLMAKSTVSTSDGGNEDDDDDDDGDDKTSKPQSGTGLRVAPKSDLSKLSNRLRLVSLAGLSRNEQTVLAAIAKACGTLRKTLGSLDVSGARFALLAASHRELTKSEPVPLSIVASAVHSSSRDALMDHFLPAVSPGSSMARPSTSASDSTSKQQRTKMWDVARALGAGWWVSSTPDCKRLAERIARADFGANRNADDAALWYIALGRRTTLAALYRAQQNTRMAQFLTRNFNQHENRVAAGKNAYVLVSKHRLELAVSFFLLAGDVSGALSLIKSRIKDVQLALFIARVLGDEEHVRDTLNFIVDKSTLDGDDHQKSIALWLNGQHEDALRAAGSPSNKIHGDRMGENVRALVGCLPDVVHCLGHVLAIADRPPVRGTELARSIVMECRKKAVQAFLGDGSPVAALVIAFEIIRSEGCPETSTSSSSTTSHTRNQVYSRRHVETTLDSALLAATDVLQGRAVCLSGAVRSGAVDETLQQLILRDIKDLEASPLGLDRTIAAVECATFEFVKEDEVDSAVASTYAALEALEGDTSSSNLTLTRKIQAAQRNCLRMAVSKALLYVQGTLSLLHHPCFSSHRLANLLAKYKLAIAHIEHATLPRGDLFQRLALEFKGSVLSLRFAYMFLKGDWPGILQALRSVDSSWHANQGFIEDIAHDVEKEDNNSTTSWSSMAPDAVSIEALRHVASNPAILRISRSLGHVRRYRKTPSMSMVGASASATAVVVDDNFGAPTLAVSADDPFAVIRMHPALSSTLASAAAAYLATHLAAKAADFAKFVSKDARQRHRNSELYWQSGSDQGYDQSFRLIKASESLENLAEDAIAQWVPLQRFGIEASEKSISHPDEAAGAFVDLWSALGCLPEYAPSLSEAATVAAAEMAAAASRAAIEAAEQKEGGRRRRRRRERQGEFVSNAAKEGLKLFDTTSADSLYGAYPVRFSSSAQGPWSGRGRHATLYCEERSLFRTLCVSSTDPPAVVVATPKGIQEIVPSSYTTMPAGFRTHYASNRQQRRLEVRTDERLAALAVDQDDSGASGYDDDESFMNSYDGFGEGPYVPLDLTGKDSPNHSLSRLSDVGGRKAVWRHQVHAMTLASHPLRRRFASGGTDGIVRLWDFADPISLASFREDNFGRISDIAFSAYGNTMLAVYASGHVIIWDDPDVYSSHPRKSAGKSRGSRAKIIRAFDNRAASAATFLDERHTIAVVGDPTAPPSVGHSLRIFDTREPNSAFHASWSAAVNHQFEARCVSLLEDRLRVVTGGLDGSLSVVDLRTKACIAELYGHSDEVTCLALEAPRGRALVSGSANGEIRLWDSRTLLCLDTLPEAHTPTRHYWSGNGLSGLVGSYGTQGLALTDRSLISCGGDGMVKIWGPGWSDFDLKVL